MFSVNERLTTKKCEKVSIMKMTICDDLELGVHLKSSAFTLIENVLESYWRAFILQSYSYKRERERERKRK